MPLYDFVAVAKPAVARKAVVDILLAVGKLVHARQGVVTGVQSFGRVPLAYDVRKRDGIHLEGLLVQMTVMAPTSLAKELAYLKHEDRLLRWMLIRSRGDKWLKCSSSPVQPQPPLPRSPFQALGA
eukprot:SM000066S20474  [mRNA]  locus=s66:610779:611506:+ [translate_table: standard]